MKRFVALIVALTLALSVGVAPVLAADNLVANGDFEAGDTGFYSEYTYVGTTGSAALQPPYVYTVGTSPKLYHSAWTSFGDHTSGSGNMMIVNGSSNGAPAEVVWGQSVDLPVCDPVVSYALWAGQTWEAGEVLVKTDEAGKVCVKFVLTDESAIVEGWLITEAHAAAAADSSGIPQKNGNPIPGQFSVNEVLDPGVTETDWYCLDYAWEEGVPLVIAAHAKLELPELGHMESYDFCVKSGAETGLVAGGSASVSTVNPWGAVDDNVNEMPGCPCVAEWIWDAARSTGYYADNGDMIDFVQPFDIVGTPISATLKIAADNSFAFNFNGGVETTENLATDWESYAALGDFGYPYMVIEPGSSAWSKVYSYDVLGSLQPGANVLNVTGVNADWNTTSWSVNPGAVIYKLCGASEMYVVDRPYQSETGWGGEEEFSGKNWAQYITYTPMVCGTEYVLEFWAASSYPAAPAQLQVSINGVAVGDTLALTATPGQWVQFSTVWDAETATSAVIEICDIRDTYSGDDFVIDDVSFTKVA